MATQIETAPPRTMSLGTGTRPQRSPSQKQPWQSRRIHSARQSQHLPSDQETESLSKQPSHRTTASTRRQPKWWKIRLFRGMIDDVRRRAPYYWSDWRDAWDYRVVPATIYMYFAKYAPLSQFASHSFLQSYQCLLSSSNQDERRNEPMTSKHSQRSLGLCKLSTIRCRTSSMISWWWPGYLLSFAVSFLLLLFP